MRIIVLLMICWLIWWPDRQHPRWKGIWTLGWVILAGLVTWHPGWWSLVPIFGCAWSWIEAIQIILVRRFREVGKVRRFNAKVLLLIVIDLCLWLPWQVGFMFALPQSIILQQFLLLSTTVNGLATIGLVAFWLAVLIRQAWPKRVNDQLAAIIVLGAGLHDGQVPPILAARLNAAASLWRQQRQAVIVVTGARLRGEHLSEATAMGQYLINQWHIPTERILLEERAKNTWDNLRFSKSLLVSHQINGPVCLVTSSFHVWRATVYCRRQGLDWQLIAAPTPISHQPMAVTRDYLGIIRDHPRLAGLVVIIALILFEISLY